MAVEVWESVKSRSSSLGRDATRRSLKAFCRGAVDDATAETAFLSFFPVSYFGLPMDSLDTDEIIAGSMYEGVATYTRPKKNQELGLVAIDFDTTGGRHKITNSLETLSATGANGKQAPDFKGAINFNEGRVEGVEIVLPALKFSMTGVLPFDDVTVGFVKYLASQTGTKNGDGFLGFEAGELLFLGASGSTRKQSDQQPGVEIKWSFEASQNATGLSVGGISGIDKGGHDYLWVLHKAAVDGNAKQTVKQAAAVYVERVYEFSTFDGLGIPEE